jgi:hypothetical protein
VMPASKFGCSNTSTRQGTSTRMSSRLDKPAAGRERVGPVRTCEQALI